MPAIAPFTQAELYAPGHFGNSYEVMGRYEMRQYLAEAKHWGFNRYGDSFDVLDCSDPFKKRLYQDYMLSTDTWKYKKQNFLSGPGIRLFAAT